MPAHLPVPLLSITAVAIHHEQQNDRRPLGLLQDLPDKPLQGLGGGAGVGMGLGAGAAVAQVLATSLRTSAVGTLVPTPVAVSTSEGTKFCIECGEAIPSRAKFCADCGKQQ